MYKPCFDLQASVQYKTPRTSLIALAFCLLLALGGCTKEGDAVTVEELDNPVDAGPNPVQPPVPILNQLLSPADDGATLLYSYDSNLTSGITVDNPTIKSQSDVGLIKPMNTDSSTDGFEQIVLSNVDRIFVIDLETDAIRSVKRYSSRVCDIIPSETVSIDDSDPANVLLNRVHLNEAYIVTLGADSSETTCANATSFRYERLELDYSEDCFIEEDDDSVCPQAEFSVDESRARAELVFGYIDDPDNPGSSIITYRYLGFSKADEELVLYDQDQRSVIWRQDRVLEDLPAELGGSVFYQLDRLANTHYMAQFGRDIFVFEAGQSLFEQTQASVQDVLFDRTLRLDSLSSEGVQFASSSEEAILLNSGRLYRAPFAVGFVPPTDAYQIVEQPDDRFLDQALERNTGYFNQFDKVTCSDSSDSTLCEQAGDTLDGDWQLVTECSVALGCNVPVVVQDLCATEAELAADPLASGTLCTPSEYLHLNELDLADNDAELLGFVQYNSILRQVELVELDNDRLFLLVDLPSKEILVQYNFERLLSEPKASRELVLIGGRFDTQGLDIYFGENQLFATVLRQRGTRTNQCYKNGLLIPCSDDPVEEGGAAECTAFDRANGDCVQSFELYDSHTIYCGPDALGTNDTDLGDGTCNDNFIEANDDGILEVGEDGKWMQVYDRDAQEDRMLLLKADAIDTIDEGQLINPSVYFVDNVTGLPDVEDLGSIVGSVESVMAGTVRTDSLADIRLVSSEVIQSLTATNRGASEVNTQFIFNHSVVPDPDDINTQRFIESVISGTFRR